MLLSSFGFEVRDPEKIYLGSKGNIVLPMIQAEENAFRYALIAEHCIRLQQGQPDLDRMRIPFLKLTEMLAGQDVLIFFAFVFSRAVDPDPAFQENPDPGV